ncbi:hypothetical protein [Agarilytica rhodophyticola]|uniref:hypothetical protein n=1 Tax=Agarilytica rhodophyticola TaxID=1737490 RepID=UPI000B346F70|nr:hypothetical protein [Agarilytica rhodophyticola]
MSCVISSIGLVSSVGPSALDSSASIRAGISRFQGIEGVNTFDEDELEAPIVGSPIPLVTGGFIQTARWARLADRALNDVLVNAKNKAINWANMPVIWVLPDVAELYLWPEGELVSIFKKTLVAPLAKSLQQPLSSPDNGFYVVGSSGSARAIRAITRTLAQGYFEQLLCVAVDSLLEPLYLDSLIAQERIKTPNNPVGLIPGEAAAAILLEPRKDSSPSIVIYNSIYKAFDGDIEKERWRTLEANTISRLLANSIIETLSVMADHVFVGNIYLDINGEEWRSVIWGMTQVVLKMHKGIDIEQCQEVVSATSWGDIGAAGGIAHLCLANQSFRRRYAQSNVALVCTVAENGDVGVILIGESA